MSRQRCGNRPLLTVPRHRGPPPLLTYKSPPHCVLISTSLCIQFKARPWPPQPHGRPGCPSSPRGSAGRACCPHGGAHESQAEPPRRARLGNTTTPRQPPRNRGAATSGRPHHRPARDPGESPRSIAKKCTYRIVPFQTTGRERRIVQHQLRDEGPRNGSGIAGDLSNRAWGQTTTHGMPARRAVMARPAQVRRTTGTAGTARYPAPPAGSPPPLLHPSRPQRESTSPPRRQSAPRRAATRRDCTPRMGYRRLPTTQPSRSGRARGPSRRGPLRQARGLTRSTALKLLTYRPQGLGHRITNCIY